MVAVGFRGLAMVVVGAFWVDGCRGLMVAMGDGCVRLRRGVREGD